MLGICWKDKVRSEEANEKTVYRNSNCYQAKKIEMVRLHHVDGTSYVLEGDYYKAKTEKDLD